MTVDLEVEYNNRARVPEHPAIIERWAQDAAAYRAEAAGRMSTISYGDAPGQRRMIDVFEPAEQRPDALPVLFIHGGYWQALEPSLFSHVARGLNAHGVTVGVAGYDLCPEVTIGQIIAQMRQAALALSRRMNAPVVAAGHSAGGHLAACLAATAWSSAESPDGGPLVPAAFAISGLFELEPLLPTTVNAKLGLTVETAREWSPRLWAPPEGVVLDAWFGARESAEYHRQSRTISAVWAGCGIRTNCVEVPGADHFTIVGPLAEADSAMTLRLKSLALQQF